MMAASAREDSVEPRIESKAERRCCERSEKEAKVAAEK